MFIWIAGLGIVFVYFVASILATVLIRAAVLQVLWGWFVVEQFALAALSFQSAAGLITVFMIVQGVSETAASSWKLGPNSRRGADRAGNGDGDDEDQDRPTSMDDSNRSLKESLTGLLTLHVVLPLTILALGWVIKQSL